MNRRVIIILGMHRSGTSAVAEVLFKAGCVIGDPETLLKPDTNNARGYFEQSETVSINESILHTRVIKRLRDCHEFTEFVEESFIEERYIADLGWIFGTCLSKNEITKDLPTEQKRIGKFLSSVYGENNQYQPVLIKDPRFSITLPAWMGHLKDPVVIMLIRHPEAVARSLWERDHIFMSLGYELWSLYTRAALSNIKGLPFFIIDYDRLLEQPQNILASLFEWLEKQDINPGVAGPESLQGIINSELRHQKNASNKDASNPVYAFYMNLLDHIPSMPVDVNEGEEFNNIQNLWNSAAYIPLLRAISTLSHKNDILQARCEHLLSRMIRVNSHPVSGPVLRILRFIKQDETFGQQD